LVLTGRGGLARLVIPLNTHSLCAGWRRRTIAPATAARFGGAYPCIVPVYLWAKTTHGSFLGATPVVGRHRGGGKGRPPSTTTSTRERARSACCDPAALLDCQCRRGFRPNEIYRMWRRQRIPQMRRVPARRILPVASVGARRRPRLVVVGGLL
jgi:hypothetical protein